LVENRCGGVCVLEFGFLHGEKEARPAGYRRLGYGGEL
jgi:hypothetical protein